MRVSAVTPGDVGEWDGVNVEVKPFGHDITRSCNRGSDYRTFDTTSIVGAEAIVTGEPTDDACHAAGKYLVQVSR